jgi:hypothetical protein
LTITVIESQKKVKSHIEFNDNKKRSVQCIDSKGSKRDKSIHFYAHCVSYLTKIYIYIIINIISLLMSPLLGHRPSLWITHSRPHPPRGPSAGWWVLMTANAAGTNGFTCFPKHGGTRDNKFFVTHPITNVATLDCTPKRTDRALYIQSIDNDAY